MKKKPSWTEWYYENIKKESKDEKEELEKCRKALEVLWKILDIEPIKPLFMEELLEVLEDFDEDQIEDALLDMLGLPFVFHIDSYIKLYLRWKDKINFEKSTMP